MPDFDSSPQPNLRVLSSSLLSKIRRLATHSKNIRWSAHAQGRMEQRGIFATDALRILRSGELKGDPELTERGELKCKLVRQLRGGRVAGVVVVMLRNDHLFVKTVEWEDRS